MRTWSFLDKSGWGDGPWVGEPDKAQWVDEATGLTCLAVRNFDGAWCGFVGVPPGHPYHGLDWAEVRDLSAHGGLSFSVSSTEASSASVRVLEERVCARVLPTADLPEWRVGHTPSGPDDRPWWFGFDCSHPEDVAPGRRARERTWGLFSPVLRGEAYRDFAYVRAECADLAGQLAAVAANEERPR